MLGAVAVAAVAAGCTNSAETAPNLAVPVSAAKAEGRTPAWWANREIMLPGQIAAEFEAGQQHPGDYEAQVSQRPIAIHGLEHLGATDREVTMVRNQIRRSIRAVRTGDEPPGLCHTTGAVTPTYCNDTVVRVPPAEAPPAADARDRAAAGRGLSQGPAADDGAAEAGGAYH